MMKPETAALQTMPPIAPYLELIRKSIEAIENYRPPDQETFLSSPVLQDAVLMRLQVIGENLVQMRALDDGTFDTTSGRIVAETLVREGRVPSRVWPPAGDQGGHKGRPYPHQRIAE